MGQVTKLYMAEELNEGEVIEPHVRHVERDAAKWQIISTDGEEVTFRAGTEVFRVHKSGTIYKEWEREAKRRADGGKMEQPYAGMIINTTPEPVFEIGKDGMRDIQRGESKSYAPMLRMIDTQLEERQHRLSELRKKYNAMDWGVEKDAVLLQMVDLEKKILGDP